MQYKPAELIFSNLMSKPPARIEQWNLRLHSWQLSWQIQGYRLCRVERFQQVKGDLTVNDQASIILCGSAWEPTRKSNSIAHEGHQGFVKTKQLLREKLWFPKIDDRVKKRVDHYVACQANTLGSRPDPLQMSIYHHNHGTQFLWTFSHGLVFVCGDWCIFKVP